MYFAHENMIDFEPELCEYGYPSFTIVSNVSPGNILELVDGEYISVDVAATERSVAETARPRFRSVAVTLHFFFFHFIKGMIS